MRILLAYLLNEGGPTGQPTPRWPSAAWLGEPSDIVGVENDEFESLGQLLGHGGGRREHWRCR